MRQNQDKNKVQKNFKEFIEHRKNLSEFDKKLEASALIHQLESVDVNKAFNSVNNRIDSSGKTINIFTAITRVAAILSIPLLMLTIWSLFLHDSSTQNSNDISWQELTSPTGMRSQIVLPDGTKMWLNAQSSVRYSTPFITDNRTIELSGEAFLDVSNNKNSPFIVKSANCFVEVVGTQFNIKAYPEENNIEVALKEGEIIFNVADENQKEIKMNPGEYMIFNKNNSQEQLTNTNIEKYIAWHQNVLILDETSMEELAVLLQRWYGVNVVIQNDELKKYKFSTTFENETLFRVIELLELSTPDIEINYSPGKVDNKTGNLNQSTVLITLKK